MFKISFYRQAGAILTLAAGIFILSSLFFGSIAFAKCTQDELMEKIFISMAFRNQQLEKSEDKREIHLQAAGPFIDRIGELESSMQQAQDDSAQKQKAVDELCTQVNMIVAIADDVLAGGKGTAKNLKTPWKKFTPEQMLGLEAQIQQLCTHDEENKCQSQEVYMLREQSRYLKQQLDGGSISLGDYIDMASENNEKMISALK